MGHIQRYPCTRIRFSMALYEPFVIVEDSQNRFADFMTHENGDHVGVAEGLNITTSTFTTISSSLSKKQSKISTLASGTLFCKYDEIYIDFRHFPKNAKTKFFLSLLVFDIPPKISFLCKNNFPFFESFTLTKIRIELSCYLTNLAKSGPEKKCFVSFASKSIFWFRHAKNCFTKNRFFN